MTNTEIYRKVVWKINQQLNGFYVPRLMIDREILDDCEIYYNIFSHDFAKAFWGKDEICFHCNGDSKDWVEGTCPECFCNSKYRSKWKFNLQQMIIEKQPLKYLEKFL